MLDLIPAIDIKDGQCVRLFKGDFDQATVYGDDPASIARRWVEQGATRLHLVDLDGARAGQPVNTRTIAAIRAAVDVPLQLGGGLRHEADVATAFENGINRIILGTVAVREPALVGRMVDRFGDSVIVSVDARDGWVATSGWTTTEQVRARELIDQMTARGVVRIVYTDIARDGTLTSPNYDALAELVQPDGPAIIASGGIARVEHLQRLADLGVEGAIIGKAMYTGAIVLPEAIAALS